MNTYNCELKCINTLINISGNISQKDFFHIQIYRFWTKDAMTVHPLLSNLLGLAIIDTNASYSYRSHYFG